MSTETHKSSHISSALFLIISTVPVLQENNNKYDQ